MLGSNEGGIAGEMQNNIGKTTCATCFFYNNPFTLISVSKIAKMTVRKQAPPFVHTLWAVAGTGDAFRKLITITHPLCPWEDQADIQSQDGKEDMGGGLFYQMLSQCFPWQLGDINGVLLPSNSFVPARTNNTSFQSPEFILYYRSLKSKHLLNFIQQNFTDLVKLTVFTVFSSAFIIMNTTLMRTYRH